MEREGKGVEVAVDETEERPDGMWGGKRNSGRGALEEAVGCSLDLAWILSESVLDALS